MGNAHLTEQSYVRNYVKRQALQVFTELLYGPQETNLNIQMSVILRENNRKLKANADYFTFAGQRYPSVFGGTGVKLDPAFETRVTEIIQAHDSVIKVERPYILNSINTFLNKSFSYHDAVKYFPEGALSICRIAWPEADKIHPAVMSDSALQALKEKNARGLLQMEILIAHNVLV